MQRTVLLNDKYKKYDEKNGCPPIINVKKLYINQICKWLAYEPWKLKFGSKTRKDWQTLK